MGQHEYSVGLASARTKEDMKKLADKYLAATTQQESRSEYILSDEAFEIADMAAEEENKRVVKIINELGDQYRHVAELIARKDY